MINTYEYGRALFELAEEQGLSEVVLEELSSVGLDIPQITQLMDLLRQKGLDVPDGIYTVDAAVESLKKLLQ